MIEVEQLTEQDKIIRKEIAHRYHIKTYLKLSVKIMSYARRRRFTRRRRRSYGSRRRSY